jgi:hypothetical protein
VVAPVRKGSAFEAISKPFLMESIEEHLMDEDGWDFFYAYSKGGENEKLLIFWNDVRFPTLKLSTSSIHPRTLGLRSRNPNTSSHAIAGPATQTTGSRSPIGGWDPGYLPTLF